MSAMPACSQASSLRWSPTGKARRTRKKLTSHIRPFAKLKATQIGKFQKVPVNFGCTAALVGCRTQLVNHVRGAVKSFGGRLPKCPARTFHKRAPAHIPDALRPALEPILEQIGSLTERIREYDRRLETASEERYPETQLLRQVEGIGPLTALCFVLTLEDPYRFERSRSVGAYLGLVPAKDQSGERDPQKRISKEGDEMLSVSFWSQAPITSSVPSARIRI